MKKTIKLISAAILFIFFIGSMAVSVSAYTISFIVFDNKEENYIYEDIGSNNSNGSRFCDASSYIIYEFPVKTTDKYVSLNWTIANQYAVYVCTTNPDDFDEWIPIYFLEKPADAATADWADFNLHNVTHDLSKYAEKCTQNKIWIIMADSDSSGGWGGYISNSDPVTFKTSQSEPVVGAAKEYVPTIVETDIPPVNTEVEDTEPVATGNDNTSSSIDLERYKKPVFGFVGGAISLAIFGVVYFIKRAV